MLKGSGPSTYECLKDRTNIKWSMEKARDYIQELVQARKDYVETGKYYTEFAMKNLPLTYGCSKMGGPTWIKYREDILGLHRTRKNEADDAAERPRKKAKRG